MQPRHEIIKLQKEAIRLLKAQIKERLGPISRTLRRYYNALCFGLDGNTDEQKRINVLMRPTPENIEEFKKIKYTNPKEEDKKYKAFMSYLLNSGRFETAKEFKRLLSDFEKHYAAKYGEE